MDPVPSVLFVPVVPTRCPGLIRVRTARGPDGDRVGLAFGNRAALTAAMGAEQEFVRLSLRTLQGMLTPIGVTSVIVDPDHVGAPHVAAHHVAALDLTAPTATVLPQRAA